MASTAPRIVSNPFTLTGLSGSFFFPIFEAIELVLPKYIKKNLKDPKVRKLIVEAADKALIVSHPELRPIPSKWRKRIIAKILDLVIDEILQPPRRG